MIRQNLKNLSKPPWQKQVVGWASKKDSNLGFSTSIVQLLNTTNRFQAQTPHSHNQVKKLNGSEVMIGKIIFIILGATSDKRRLARPR